MIGIMDPVFRKQLFYAMIVNLAYTLYSITRGFCGHVGEQIVNEKKLGIGESDAYWIVSMSIIMNPVGGIIAGIMADLWGRIFTIKLATALCAFSWSMIAMTSNESIILCPAFILLGLSTGMLAISSVYIAEISTNYRCFLLSLFIIYFTGGVALGNAVGTFLPWRQASWIFMAVSCVSLSLFHILYESPEWLARKGKLRDAAKTLQKLENISESKATHLIENMRESHNQRPVRFRDVRNAMKPFILLVVLQCFFQGTGYPMLMTYNKQIFSHFTLPISIESMVVIFSLTLSISGFFAPVAVYFLHRKMQMTVAGQLMTCAWALLLFSIIFDFHGILSWIVPIAGILFVFSCTTGCFILADGLPAEFYKTEVRGLMCGITNAFGTILTGSSIKIFPIILRQVDIKILLLFWMTCSFCICMFGKYYLPETKGKTLEEIQAEYFDKKPCDYKDEKDRGDIIM